MGVGSKQNDRVLLMGPQTLTLSNVFAREASAKMGRQQLATQALGHCPVLSPLTLPLVLI